MSEALSVYREPEVTAEQLELVRKTVAAGATTDELALYIYDCKRQGVHPLDRLLHFTKRGGKYVPITSIDLFRSRAGDTGELAGIDDAIFEGAQPNAATITVYRMVQGVRCPFTATARWSEYVPQGGQDHMWRRMPFTMLAKCAEALALRKAFPKQLAGVYTKDEMDQSEGPRPPRTPRKGELVRGHPESEAAVVEAVESGELVPAQPGEGSTEGRFQPDQAEEFKKLHGMAAARGLFGGKSTPAGRRNYLCAELGRVIAKLEDVTPEEWLLVKSAVVRLIEQARENGGTSVGRASGGLEAPGASEAAYSDRPSPAEKTPNRATNNGEGGDARRDATISTQATPAPGSENTVSRGRALAAERAGHGDDSATGPDRLPSPNELLAINAAIFPAIARCAAADVSVGSLHLSNCQGAGPPGSGFRLDLWRALCQRDLKDKKEVTLKEWEFIIRRLNDLASGVLSMPMDAA